MASLTTNFNVTPYFDDYEEAKRYYRILFRPSVAVQARELTQLQTIQQKQIERFGNHVFKDGSIVEGCSPSVLKNLNFVRIEDSFIANTNLSVTDISSEYLLVGQTSNVRASVVISKNGFVEAYPETNRFYYTTVVSGTTDKVVFQSGETIKIYNENQNKLGTLNEDNLIDSIKVLTSNSTVNAIGQGYGLKIENGIIYQKGFFQIIEDQTVLVKEYDQQVGDYVVGFSTVEEIINEAEDPSLNDNALGYSNENAPGSHRLKLTVVPVVRLRSEILEDESFFAAYEFSNITNDLIINREKNSYDELGEVLSARTYEESGDYVVKPFITDSIASNNNLKFYYTVSSGSGYVRGNRVEYESSRKIETDRATDTIVSNAQTLTTNYGNFVYVKELYGALNFSDFINIDIYSAAQQAATTRFNPSLSGSKIGTARVKAVLHHEGNPGVANTTYRLYLSDIVMNSGKSFYNDAKSFYASSGVNSFGAFYADIVLNSSNNAVVQTSGKTGLVFPIGKSAIRRLRSANGSVNDTEFVYRVSSTATMGIDGKIAITVPSPSPGGLEELGYSEGVLGDVLEDQFLITLTQTASTANLAGTVAVTSGNTQILASGFDSKFSSGEIITLFNGASPVYHTVTSSNSTVLIVNPAPGFTNNATVTAKRFPAGYSIPMDNSYAGSRAVNITSPTTFDIDTDMDAVANLLAPASVVVQYRMRRKQATQTRKDVRKNRYVKVTANSAVNGAMNLGMPDVYKINKVYVNGNTTNDVTSYFNLDNGQKLDYYDHSKLVLKPEYSGFLTTQTFTVVLDHFAANTTNGIGFFSVDSYPIDDANTANTTAIQTAEIPTFTYEDVSINLRDAVDFRPYKVSTAVSSTTEGGATTNPATTNNFVSSSVKYIAEPDTEFQADVEYYLARKDLITLNISGALNVVKGTPSENPKIPQNNADTMILAVADVPPYPTLTPDEATAFGKPDSEAIQTEIYTNRVYTMRDIGVLDQRLQNLEYYTSLLALEASAKDLDVRDEAGLNRFKNGIFVDPMTSYDFHAYTNPEYKFTLDTGNTYGRSTFSQRKIQLDYNSSASSGVLKTGRYLTKPYTDELYILQQYATKFRNNAQDFWKWNGSVTLLPGYDVNTEVSQGRPSFEFRIFIDSTTVSFVAAGLRPNSRIYPFFDDIAVSEHCAPASVNTELGANLEDAIEEATKRGRPETALVRTGAFNAALRTDSSGNLLGVFRIPANTFKVGDRIFRLVDVDNLTTGSDAILTEAATIFTGYNVSITFPPPPPPPPPPRDGGPGRRDPLAQSFEITAPEGQSGVFLTKIDLFFKRKDPNLGLEIVVVGMDAGFPNDNDVKGTAKIKSNDVLISDDASLATTIKFDFPIYLTANQPYAFYVVPEGNNPNYQMWVCEMGDFDILTRAQVSQNPYVGDLFRSSNQITWTALTTEDAKFNLYVANFDVGTGTAYFENESDDFISLTNVAVANAAKPISVGNEVYKINSAGDITIPTAYRELEGYVQSYNTSNRNLILNNSKGAFRNSDVIGFFDPPQQGNVAQCNSTTLIATATISSINNPVMHSVLPKMLSIVPSGTSVNYSLRSTSNTGVIDGSYSTIVSNVQKDITDFERVVYSYSNEVEASLQKTFSIKATLNNTNKYVSPIIDLTQKSAIVFENIINNSSTNEHTSYGSSLVRYISKPVVLADRQDAEDFLLYLTGYRPVSTDILVYVKFLSGQDPASINSKVWTKLVLQNSTLRSSSVNSLDFKEFVYGLPTAPPVATAAYKPEPYTEIMRYADSSGAIYYTYKSFVIKVVLLSSNKVYVPKVNDIRAIALQT